jgi:CheY-like chemotaxis protein
LTLSIPYGYGQDQDRQQALDVGFDHFLVKPSDPQELKKLFDGVLPDQRQAGRHRLPGRRGQRPVLTGSLRKSQSQDLGHPSQTAHFPKLTNNAVLI